MVSLHFANCSQPSLSTTKTMIKFKYFFVCVLQGIGHFRLTALCHMMQELFLKNLKDYFSKLPSAIN